MKPKQKNWPRGKDLVLKRMFLSSYFDLRAKHTTCGNVQIKVTGMTKTVVRFKVLITNAKKFNVKNDGLSFSIRLPLFK